MSGWGVNQCCSEALESLDDPQAEIGNNIFMGQYIVLYCNNILYCSILQYSS